MPESAFREEVKALGISIQGVMQFRYWRREQDASKNSPHLRTLYCLCAEVQKVQSLTSLDKYIVPKVPLQYTRC